MISIYMYDGKWRLKIGDEIWEFGSASEMQEVLKDVIGFKDRYGRIEDNEI